MVALLTYALIMVIGLLSLACTIWFLTEGLPKVLAYFNILQGPATGPKRLYMAAAILMVGLGVALTMGIMVFFREVLHLI